jgi:transcriptional regulator with PAS, ATPase and Fis domain
MVSDIEGRVTHFNEPYGQFLGVDPAEQIGRHVTEVVENTRMHLVARTGRAEINDFHSIGGQEMVVQRIPIRKGDRVIGVFGQVMFKNVQDVAKLARKLQVLESKVKRYEAELDSLRGTRYTFDSIQGASRALRDLKAEALQASTNDLPVLITGESGTGKELFAQAIHAASPRRRRPFVRINCAAIPPDLFEAELFGYEQGAFTGAGKQGKPGKFELAHGGTIFLDEVGELPKSMQPKLLRVLEEKELERVGGTRLVRTDFRLIAATNQPLEELLTGKEFRKDLYYRLNVVPLGLPPLRERPEDITALSRYFLERLSRDSRKVYHLSQAAAQVLMAYSWPGNVRELYNVLERVTAGTPGGHLLPSHLPKYLNQAQADASPPNRELPPLRDVLERAEKEALRQALALCDHNKSRAADLLGIHRTLLYKKLKKHSLPG